MSNRLIAARKQRAERPEKPGGRRRRRAADQRGVALVMVLGAITVLTVFLTELQEETSSELSAALADRDALKAEYYARSAVNLSRLLIATEPTIRRAIGPIFAMMGGSREPPQIPVWKFSDMVLGPFNDQVAASAFAGLTGADPASGKNLGLTGGGRFELKIVDEESKINVNRAADDIDITGQLRVGAQLAQLMAPPQYSPLFEGRDADDQFSDRTQICSALVDWVDSPNQLFTCDQSSSAQGSSGAEDSFYESLGLGYRRKNAAFDSVDELRLVRGVSDDFWATFVDPDPADPDKRVLTVWGNRDAAINVSAASPLALLAVTCAAAPEATLCTNPEQMTAFLSTISLVQSIIPGGIVFPSKSDFYAAVTQGTKPMIGAAIGGVLKSMNVEPVKFKSPSEFKKSLSQETRFLSIYADGIVPGNKRETRVRIHAVVDLTGAKKLSEALGNLVNGTQPGGSPPPVPPTTPGGTPESAWEQTVRSNPAGTIVYYRIE
jgi:general secretion pathway protein K